jgi:fumarate reductase subunit C
VSAGEALRREQEEVEREAAPRGARARVPRAYPNRLPADWWRRNRRYLLYLIRELTAVPIALWMIWFLFEIAKARGGAGVYTGERSPVFVVLSAVCLVFALWHSYTFLRLSGLIVRIPLGQGTVSPRIIVGGSFALLFLATVVIGGLLVLGGK